ncbi:MAG: hypothetical protein DMF63_09005 [Acidobacteria bacterium]|nr:MAG: hypothetical protein DMF63_09005 [Acidobacteriota bacterium]
MKNTIKSIILATLLVSLTQLVSAAPQNDNWGNATSLASTTAGQIFGSISGATVQSCEPSHSFPDEAGSPAEKTVWYKWQVPASGSYTFSFYGTETTIDPVLSAYRMTVGFCNGDLGEFPQRVIENHNYNVAMGVGQDTSRITFRATAGELIYISVDSWMGQDGSFEMNWNKARFRYDANLDHNNGGADLVVNRLTPGGMQWWTARYRNSPSFNYFGTQTFGKQFDKMLMADYDGDGISDMVAVRRENGSSVWWISNKDGQIIKVVQFGLEFDEPIVGDYDGDGIADIAVVRKDEGSNTRTWHILRSSDGHYVGAQFGLANDRLMAGDYDGDGKTDLVVLRAENGSLRWYILRSGSNQVVSRLFGNDTGDAPVAVDFGGDGKTDIAVFRRNAPASQGPTFSGYWFSLDSNSQLPLDEVPTQFQKFGTAFDEPQPGDFDGDGRTDLAVYRDGQWWIRRTRDGQVSSHNFGIASDYPMTDGGRYILEF